MNPVNGDIGGNYGVAVSDTSASEVLDYLKQMHGEKVDVFYGALLVMMLGMDKIESKSKKLMRLKILMEQFHTDTVELNSLLNQLKMTSADLFNGKSGPTGEAVEQVQRLVDLWHKMYGNTQFDDSGNIIGDPDENSDFGIWCKAKEEMHVALYGADDGYDITQDQSYTTIEGGAGFFWREKTKDSGMKEGLGELLSKVYSDPTKTKDVSQELGRLIKGAIKVSPEGNMQQLIADANTADTIQQGIGQQLQQTTQTCATEVNNIYSSAQQVNKSGDTVKGTAVSNYRS